MQFVSKAAHHLTYTTTLVMCIYMCCFTMALATNVGEITLVFKFQPLLFINLKNKNYKKIFHIRHIRGSWIYTKKRVVTHTDIHASIVQK